MDHLWGTDNSTQILQFLGQWFKFLPISQGDYLTVTATTWSAPIPCHLSAGKASNALAGRPPTAKHCRLCFERDACLESKCLPLVVKGGPLHNRFILFWSLGRWISWNQYYIFTNSLDCSSWKFLDECVTPHTYTCCRPPSSHGTCLLKIFPVGKKVSKGTSDGIKMQCDWDRRKGIAV